MIPGRVDWKIRKLTVDRSFVRNNKMFRLPYTYIDICKDGSGGLKCLELNGGVGQQTPFVHSCASGILEQACHSYGLLTIF